MIASGNPGKIREFAELLSGSMLEPVAPSDLGVSLDVEETGVTYMENALTKAQAYAGASGLPALADDSGIEVEALGGSPGLYSARYGGPGLSDADRTARLLSELRDTAPRDRGARYYCALVLMMPDGRNWQAEGICEGVIAASTRGSNGFGYDPVFFLPAFQKTMAELSSVEKNGLSHRARAVQALLARLNEEMPMSGDGTAGQDIGRLSHIDAAGRARMVDVTDKDDTSREAIARGRVLMQPATLELILAGEISKGNVLTTAQIGGIMAAKRTHELIPLCHPLPLTAIHVDLEPDKSTSSVDITARVRTTAKTGVEMEALTAVSVAALTIYDMCKAVDRGMHISDIRLAEKRGGKSGEIVLE